MASDSFPSQTKYVLGEADLAQMRELLARLRSMPQNIFGRGSQEEQGQSPEVHIALTPSGGIAAIGPLGTGTGTGPDNINVPDSGECDIYRVLPDPASGTDMLQGVGFTETVYNLSETELPERTFIKVSRNKWGSWVADFIGASGTDGVSVTGIHPGAGPFTGTTITCDQSTGIQVTAGPNLAMFSASDTQSGVVDLEDMQILGAGFKQVDGLALGPNIFLSTTDGVFSGVILGNAENSVGGVYLEVGGYANGGGGVIVKNTGYMLATRPSWGGTSDWLTLGNSDCALHIESGDANSSYRVVLIGGLNKEPAFCVTGGIRNATFSDPTVLSEGETFYDPNTGYTFRGGVIVSHTSTPTGTGTSPCQGVVTACCACVPATLHATLSLISGSCGCFTPFTIVLRYSPTSFGTDTATWTGGITIGGPCNINNVFMELRCLSGSWVFDLYMTTASGICLNAIGTAATSNSCFPFQVAANFTLEGSCAGCGGGSSTSCVSLGFVSASSQYAIVSNMDSLASATAFAFSCWIKVGAASTGDNYIVSGALGGWYFKFDNAGRLAFGKNGGVSVSASLTSTKDGAWHNVGFYFDGTGGVTFFYDGASVGTSSGADTAYNSSGATYNLAAGPGPTYSDIKLMDARVYVLFANPFTDIYNAGCPSYADDTAPATSCSYWWKLNEGVGAVIANSGTIGSAGNGSLVNSPAWAADCPCPGSTGTGTSIIGPITISVTVTV